MTNKNGLIPHRQSQEGNENNMPSRQQQQEMQKGLAQLQQLQHDNTKQQPVPAGGSTSPEEPNSNWLQGVVAEKLKTLNKDGCEFHDKCISLNTLRVIISVR